MHLIKVTIDDVKDKSGSQIAGKKKQSQLFLKIEKFQPFEHRKLFWKTKNSYFLGRLV